MHRSNIAGVVLAGGEGSRLGGIVKPLLRVGGVPILGRTTAGIRGKVSSLLISTGTYPAERFAGFDADALVPDREGPSAGPLAGLFAAVAHLRALDDAPDWLFSVAGDCPDLPPDLLERLVDAVTAEIDAVFPAFGGQAYPPNALWRVSALSAHFDALGGDPQGRGPRQLIAPSRRCDVDFSQTSADNPFEGLNTLADLVRLAKTRNAAPMADLPNSGLGKAGQTR